MVDSWWINGNKYNKLDELLDLMIINQHENGKATFKQFF
jgi:hypothetical protein